MATLTTKVIEEITLNNNSYNSERSLDISSVNEIVKRIVTISTTETGLLGFATASSPEKPMNGRLQIIGASAGQFAKTDYSPNMKIGDFYVFPYDMRHCVYPFNSTKEKRRTLVCNVDVEYDPVASRSAGGQLE